VLKRVSAPEPHRGSPPRCHPDTPVTTPSSSAPSSPSSSFPTLSSSSPSSCCSSAGFSDSSFSSVFHLPSSYPHSPPSQRHSAPKEGYYWTCEVLEDQSKIILRRHVISNTPLNIETATQPSALHSPSTPQACTKCPLMTMDR